MTQISEQIQQQLLQAHQLYGGKQFHEAEAMYRQVLNSDPVNVDALQSLVAICLQTQRLDQAEEYLRHLVEAFPEEPSYAQHYANALLRRGEAAAAIACFHRLLDKQPRLADSRYNFALLLKQAGRLDAALEQYEKSIELGIAQPEEVYSNISVIHSDQHRHTEAREALKQALTIDPNYIPALYNLALLEEESGNWDQAHTLFQQILKIDPDHSDSLIRLAHSRIVDNPDDALLGQLGRALHDTDSDDPARESLEFALGKVNDDCGRYDQAFDYYFQGNRDARRRVGEYATTEHEKLIANLTATFTPNWSAAVEPVSDAAPIFVCGMFRSGSTLLEQMLAAHPKLTAGGELSFFNVHAPLPEALASLDQQRLTKVGVAYLDHIASSFPGSNQVINKRPDNFLYLGLIRAMFPNARIIHTSRNPMDVCLSVFFQQLTPRFQYANDLLDIGHYYVHYHRLMGHWQQTLPGEILHVRYEELVSEPRGVLEPALAFVDLEWHEECLEFHTVNNRVRTASFWQVRQPLHLKSVGRWQHYAKQLEPLRSYLRDADVDF